MENLLKKIAEEHNITNYEIKITSGSKKGDGFVAQLLSIELCGDGKDLKLIGKVAPDNKQYRKQIPVKLLYDNEIHFYNKILPNFEKFAHGKSGQLRLNIPKFYGANGSEYQEVIFLENLLPSNYTMWKQELINKDHISLVLREYGKLHALSFVIKYEDKNLWNDLIAGVEDVPGLFFSESDFTESVLEQCENVVIALRSRAKDYVANKLDAFCNKKLEDVMNNSKRYFDEHSIIVHGDSWCNNYMFKYDDKDNLLRPTDVTMIDFQVVRIGSPVIDISYLLYTCLEKAELDKLEDYQQIYYSSFSEAAKCLGANISDIYPYTAFLDHWKKYSSYGLAMTLVVLHGMMSNKDEFPDFDAVFSSGKGLFRALNFISVNEERYYDRIIDIVEHFVKNDYL